MYRMNVWLVCAKLAWLNLKGFGRHQITTFGGYVLDVENNESPVLPLKTFADYEDAARLAKLAKLGEKPIAA